MANLSSYLPDGIDESSVQITGGTINGTTIGASTPSTGAFTSLTATSASTITTADNNPQLTLISTDADASEGPVLKLYRNSGSPADNDILGRIQFSGEDDAGNDSTFGRIDVVATDVSNDTEDARMEFSPAVGDAFTPTMSLTGGNVGIGTTSPSTYDSRANNLVVGDSGDSGITIFSGATSNAVIQFAPSGDTGLNNGLIDYDNNNDSMAFSTGGSERMRVNSDGGVRIGHDTNIFNGSTEERFTVKNTVQGCAATFEATDVSGGFPILYIKSSDTTANQNCVLFYRGGTNVGGITTSASSTSYNTSSDYRLKENVVSLDNATDRLKQIRVHRFNFITDPNITVDGFLAHEVSAIVPEAVSGEHNGVDASGDPVYQGIDQSKLVPLLTKAIQELEARLAALETK